MCKKGKKQGLPGIIPVMFSASCVLFLFRITGEVGWSWWWVVSPFLLYAGLYCILGLAYLVLSAAVEIQNARRRRLMRKDGK